MSIAQQAQVSPAIFVSNLFKYQYGPIPENNKQEIYQLLQEKILNMKCDNQTDFYDVVNVYDGIKTQLDEKTNLYFLKFFKGSLVSGDKSFENYLKERKFDLKQIEGCEPFEKRKTTPKRKQSVSRSTSTDFPF